MSQRPTLPKGTRDFSSTEIIKRQYITDVIKKHFNYFCFEPLETPAFENITTLMGNYGEEGDRLIFKILNSGDYIKKLTPEIINQGSLKATTAISEKALKYDLTVPFSRYVSMNHGALQLPFKRYQIQPVWRADRPQKGRFREFCQCDADVIGSDSLWQEVDFVLLYDAVFQELGLNTIIKINNRKILSGIAEVLEIDQLTNFTVALDKLDKIGKEGVVKEMSQVGISSQAIQKMDILFEMPKDNSLEALKTFLASSQIGVEGVTEIEFVMKQTQGLLEKAILELDITLARGLHYYTGCIFEVKTPDVAIGSVGGGGRYANLTENFGVKNMSGVGISFGLDRLYIALEELALFPEMLATNDGVLFLNFGDEESAQSIRMIQQCRQHNISCQLYPDAAKIKKQMTFADKKQYTVVVMIGDQEMKEQNAIVKNLKTGDQQTISQNKLVEYIQSI